MAEVATSASSSANSSARSDQLLVVVDPVARRTDGESVRIAKDVLSAGAAGTKVCLPDDPEEFARALGRRGSRRPVVVGDDRALLRAVGLLHRRRELAGCALSVVPVGPVLGLARSLGLPTGAVAAARAVLDGAERRMDLLVDDSDGVVLGAVGIPSVASEGPRGAGDDLVRGESGAGRPWLRTCQSLVRTLASSRSGRVTVAPGAGGVPPARLRVEIDGATLVDLDQPVEAVSLIPGPAGMAVVEVRPVSAGAEPGSRAVPLTGSGRAVTVSGADFRYRADAVVSGPVRTRTWTVREGAWGLMLPVGAV
ncbi:MULTISPECIES: diacylglycerol kinase family protein [Streptomyces]|uniref:Diacylglycerol kinase n=2 Tax=Streptomyces parvulus TaxID=146923 RepID=A0A191V0X2_9ACTN|nr:MULTISPECIES: diacylglycerol kinase family protein [Streptomyces]ANJ08644.1 diacylglycerol kinase [Streptomyces parvulus]MZD57153.1 diacylglycerol kinase [Streptomyces sp. SID5606]WHM31728.1 diacylglycerol kinase family protein [Streptomyces sp. BPPL-273]WML81584.1 diacylglycerol kinase family protein [Streptomyces sp. VNUA74]GGR55577.1 diacylglycerol kinase [Streptomyces parvulus]